MNLQPYLIAGSDVGLETDKKSFLLPDKAFPTLENAYVWRDRVKKREGLKLIGRLRRVLTGQSLGNTSAGATTNVADVFNTIGITGENPEIDPGSLVITVAAPDTATFTDQGDGTFAVTGIGDATGSYVNYATGEVNLQFNPAAAGGSAITASINYFPSLPVMGIIERERANINFEQTLAFDTKYCYVFDGTNYDEYLPLTSTTWNGSNSQFFWGANFRASDPSVRQLFVTNFNLDATGNPIRYTDGATWTDFEPAISSTQVTNESLGTYTAGAGTFGPVIATNFPIIPGTVTVTFSNGVDADTIFTDPAKDGTLKGSPNTNTGATIDYTTGTLTFPTISPTMPGGNAAVTIDYKYEADKLFSAKVLVPYYGRLLAFNTYEGSDKTIVGGAKQYFNRVRFSQIGDPTQIGAWDSTIFGRGGFIDAPVNEEIVSAIFYKNTLIVFFEKTTWQLRYVGDYGLPFIWERVSSDLGSESTFSHVLFDDAVLGVGDRAIIAATSQGVERIDLKIPNIVFSFRNQNQGTARVHGIRDFQRELVFWCFNDSTDTGTSQVFPNKTLLYNYRNNTWAVFRNNVTTFGRYYGINSVTWDRTDVFWDDYQEFWQDPDGQAEFPFIICGNQQGFIHFYGYHSKDEKSLSITAINRAVSPPQLTIPNHNLIDGDIIYLEGLDFIDTSDSSDVATDLNNQTYRVETFETYDANVIKITKWDTVNQSYDSNFSYTPANGTGTYIGGGTAALIPRMNIITKDFNPFTMEGKQVKFGYIDFLTDKTTSGQISVRLYTDTIRPTFNNVLPTDMGNLLVGQQEMQTQENPLFSNTNAGLIWNRFFSTAFGQFVLIQITYDEDIMNNKTVLEQEFVLNAMILWIKAGGRLSP